MFLFSTINWNDKIDDTAKKQTSAKHTFFLFSMFFRLTSKVNPQEEAEKAKWFTGAGNELPHFKKTKQNKTLLISDKIQSF